MNKKKRVTGAGIVPTDVSDTVEKIGTLWPIARNIDRHDRALLIGLSGYFAQSQLDILAIEFNLRACDFFFFFLLVFCNLQFFYLCSSPRCMNNVNVIYRLCVLGHPHFLGTCIFFWDRSTGPSNHVLVKKQVDSNMIGIFPLTHSPYKFCLETHTSSVFHHYITLIHIFHFSYICSYPPAIPR